MTFIVPMLRFLSKSIYFARMLHFFFYLFISYQVL